MKIIPVFLLITAAAVGADIQNCPKYCKCTVEGVSGINAVCTQLRPDEQLFTDVVQHLVVTPDRKAPISLTDNIFQKLGMQKLESLKIVNSSLSDISVKAFQGLNSLFDVNLSDNQLFLLHADTFANNTNLHRLKLSGNPMQLMQVLETQQLYLLRSYSLTEYDLSNCQQSQILPKTFSQLKNLVFVNLASNLLKNITKDMFEGLEYLEELDLSNNLITKIEKNAFKQNKELSVLKLRKNPIEALSGINSPNLEELDLSFCKLRILMKESIDGMPQLSLLNLSNNQIDVISDDSFTGMNELKKLDLSYNKLIGPLPKDLFRNNRNLELLSLSGNRELGTFVEETGFVEHFPVMQRLEIADCGLTKLTAGQLQNMGHLNTLKLNDNAIRELDDSVFRNLKRLTILDLSNNKLQTLSGQLFAANIELTKLKLNGNPLKYLQLSTFSHTPNLKFLNASNCELERFWDTRKSEGDKVLSKLAHLDLSSNRLKFLHIRDFSSMDNLEAVDLSGNPLECYSSMIELIDYFDSKQIDPYHPSEKLLANVEPQQSQWNGLINHICSEKKSVNQIPSSATKADKLFKKLSNRSVLRPMVEHAPVVAPVVEHAQAASFTSVDEIVVETDSWAMWPMVLAVSILIVALYFIIYLVGEITHRRRTMAAPYTRPGPLGGHVRSRDASGSPLYYKLYEECSIPAQPTKKKNYVLDFSPIHTILKKNTYKIMRNNEANV